MRRLSCNILISSFTFTFVTDLTIESTWETLTDSVKITLPRKLIWEGKDIIGGNNPLIKRGDKVKIDLGYDDNLTNYFTGFVSKVNPRTPIELTCEDEIFQLKQKAIKNYSSESSSLSQMLTGIGLTNFKAIDTQIGSFRVPNSTIAQCLEHLRSNYGFQSFFRDGVLYVGLAYYPEMAKTIEKQFQFDIIDDNLEYRRDDDTKIKVKAISILKDNTKIIVEVGDPDGDLRTLHFYNITKTELVKYANRELPKLKYTGFWGDFTTFGDVKIRHGDIVSLIDKKLPDRNGKYLVKKVDTSFGLQGFRQKVYLDSKVQ